MKKGKKEARMEMLRELKREMSQDRYGEDMKKMGEGMKKITIASPTEKGLREGLKQAPGVLTEAEKIMKGRKEFACGGMKKGDKYEDGGYKTPKKVKESMKSLMEKADEATSEELKEKIKKLREKSK